MQPTRVHAVLFPFCLALGAVLAQDPIPAPAQAPQGIPDCQEMQTTASGLQWGVLQKGSEGPHPAATDTVKVHYTGWLPDGTKFDSSRDRGQPAEFPLNRVIKGWTEGLQLMTPGERCKFVIPGELAYGAAGRPPKIPANATLVFDVELIEVKVAPKMPEFPKGNPDAVKACESGLKYEYLKHGTGAMVGADAAGSFRYAIFGTDGRLFECTEQQGNKLAGTTKSLRPEFLRELLPTVKVGDVLRLEVPKSMLGQNAPDTVWEVELLAITEVPKFTMPDAKKLVTTDSGLQYEVVKAGTGKTPTLSSTVLAHYTGWLTDGTMFDSSVVRGEPTEFPLNGVIKGWTEGLQLMQEGGIYKFVIPAALGYGSADQGTIPPNSTLVFQVELVKVK